MMKSLSQPVRNALARALALASLALALSLACAVPAAAALDFDGKRQGLLLTGSDSAMVSADIQTIILQYTPVREPDNTAKNPAGIQPGAFLMDLRSPTQHLLVSFGSGIDDLVITNQDDATVSASIPRRGTQSVATLIILRKLDGSWDIHDGMNIVASLPVGFFAPEPSDPVLPQIGGAGFFGQILQFNVQDQNNEQVVGLTSAGELALRFDPALGIYHRADAQISAPRQRDLGSNLQHGLYERESFLALAKRDGQLGVVFDWGGFFPLKRDPKSPRRFVPAAEHNAWVGGIEFAEGSTEVFIPGGQAEYRSSLPTFDQGRHYVRVEQLGDLANQHPSGQSLDEVWVADAKPSGFAQSIKACFDVIRTDLVDYQNTGCTSTIFQLPPLESANYRGSDDNTIVPFGWRYDRRHRQQGDYFSSIATNTSEIETSHNGGQGFNATGFGSVSQNSSYENEKSDMLTDERMTSVHQNIATSHAIVLDPIYVRLNDCFIRRVMRMVPDAAPPAYFDPETDPRLRRPGGSDDSDWCPEDFQGPSAIPLSISDFLDLYGTHYAYALTYGAWGRQTITYTDEAIQSLVSENVKIDQTVGGEATVRGIKFGASQQSEEGRGHMNRLENEGKLERGTYVCVGGSSCSDGNIDAGTNLVPVYMHLRPLDGLLGPPYFTDPKVAVDLRQKVQAEIARRSTGNVQAPRPPFRLVRLSVDKVECVGDDWFSNTLCSPHPWQRPIGGIDLSAYARMADGTKTELSPPQAFPLSQVMGGLKESMFVVSQSTPRGPVDQVGFSLSPTQANRAAGAVTDHGCCDETWYLGGDLTVSAESSPHSWLGDATLSIRPNAKQRSSGLSGEITMSYDSPWPESRFKQNLLNLNGIDSSGILVVNGTLNQVNIAKELGFSEGRGWVSAAFESTDAQAGTVFQASANPMQAETLHSRYMVCPPGSSKRREGCEFARPPQSCPAALKRYGNFCALEALPLEVHFTNTAPIFSSGEVQFVSGGQRRKVSTRTLAVNQSDTILVPADAQNIVLTALYHGLGSKQVLMGARIDPAMGPACALMTGNAFRPDARMDFGCRSRRR